MNDTAQFARPPQARPAPPPLAPNRKAAPPALASNAMQPEDMAVGSFFAWVDNDVTLDDILRPGYWAHYASKTRLGASVRVMRRDCTLIVDLVVVGVAVGMVKMLATGVHRSGGQQLEQRADVADDDLPDLPDGYKVKHMPNPAGYHAFTPQGDRLTKEGLSKPAAYKAAIDHHVAASTAAV